MAAGMLVAPDSFKGTFGAAEVAAALGAGLRAAGADPDLCPVADGGEGTAEILLGALGGEWRDAEASDPLGRPVAAGFALLGGGETAALDVAAASGLSLVAEDERDAEAASTGGTGQLIAAAAAAGARRILVGAGGSATTDGGAGAIDAINAAGGLGGAELVVLCDTELTYDEAARVFAPQKGADAAAVERLAGRLALLAEGLPRSPRGIAYGGCAGGLSGGLWAAFNAELRPGAPFVLDLLGFGERLEAAAAVIAGEGRLDSQSTTGKVVGEIAARARAAGRPLHLVVGSSDIGPEEAGELLGAASLTVASTLEEVEAAGAGLSL
jgi:glycerate 2-kinase